MRDPLELELNSGPLKSNKCSKLLSHLSRAPTLFFHLIKLIFFQSLVSLNIDLFLRQSLLEHRPR